MTKQTYTRQQLEQFEGFAFSDIDKSIECGTNFLTALALLCYTEYIGALINNNVGERGKSELNFDTCFHKMGPEYKHFDKLCKNNFKKSFYEMFRCGLVHQYFADHPDMVIAKTSNTKPGVGFSLSGTPGMANRNYFNDLKSVFEQLTT